MEVMGLGCALGMGKRRAVGRKSQMVASLMTIFQAREGNAPGELLQQTPGRLSSASVPLSSLSLRTPDTIPRGSH